MSVTTSPGGSARDQRTIPATLADAHEELWGKRPARDAEPGVWVDFHRHSASVYARVSEIDRQRKGEALTCAGMEIRKARDIEHRLYPEDDDE